MSAFAMNEEMNFGAPESRKVEWASSGATETKSTVDEPIRASRDLALSQKFLSLPRFKGLDILDLIRLAEDKVHRRVSDRIAAIAILVGNEPLDSPFLQRPLVLSLAPGTPKYL